jgi:hypothetical protein
MPHKLVTITIAILDTKAGSPCGLYSANFVYFNHPFFRVRRIRQIMRERRKGERYNISFPIRLKWKDENGQQMSEDGLTENVSPKGVLVYLPRFLPQVGSRVKLTVTEQAEEISVTAEVLRVERNAAHPQAALMLTRSVKLWKEKVWEYAREVLENEKPEEHDDW